MKHIFLNLKRFDVPAALGGVNRIDERFFDYAMPLMMETMPGYAILR